MGGSASEAAAQSARGVQARLELAQGRLGRILAGRWTLTSVLGIGGSATVYEACHRNGRRAALKVLHPELAASPTLVQRFMSEGYAANKVHHAGAVLALDDGEDDGLVFLVLELLDGRSLAERLAQSGPLPLDDVIRISVDVLEVLAAAHERGVIHRDVKPGNIFELAPHGGIKVLDFGVAHVREPGTQAITQSGFTLGTPAFMAPEQAAGRIDIDALTDIWAVGATMFQLLTGRLVHDAATPNAALLAAATVPVRPIRALKPELPEDVAAIIDRALAFERKERWPNASAMRLALARARPQAAGRASETPLWLGPETLPPAPAESSRRRWRTIWIPIAVLLGFGVLFGSLLLRSKRADTLEKSTATAMPAAVTAPPALAESPRPDAEPSLPSPSAAPILPSARHRPPIATAAPQKARPPPDDEILLDRRK